MREQPARALFAAARDGGYALAAFNVNNLETAQAVIEAAEASAAPVVLQVSPGAIAYAGYKPLSRLAMDLADGAAVPVIVHLDHCRDAAVVERAIEDGYDSVMFDGSPLEFDENVRLTAAARGGRATTSRRRRRGGARGDRRQRGHGSRRRGTPRRGAAKAAAFAVATGIDIIAPALGNLHRMPDDSTRLDVALVRDIAAATGLPIALHGASGIAREQLPELVAAGIAKVNISSRMSRALAAGIRESWATDGEAVDLRRFLGAGRDRVRDMAAEYIRLTGSAGRAATPIERTAQVDGRLGGRVTVTVVLNLGLKSVRAAAFDATGGRIGIAYRPIVTRLGEGMVEQDPEGWWRSALETLDELAASVELRGHGRAHHRDRLGRLPRRARRGRARGSPRDHDQRRPRQGPRGADRGAPGLRPPDAGQRRVTPDLMVPKIAWFRAAEPEADARTRWLVSPNDFLVQRLTGEVVTDPATASKFWFDPAGDGAYPEPLRDLGVDLERLPPVVTGAQAMLPLRAELRDRYGFPPSVRVVLSTYDALCAVYGSGVTRIGEACDVSGTVTSFRVVTARSERDPEGRVFLDPAPRAGPLPRGGSNNLSGGVLEWARQVLYTDDPDPVPDPGRRGGGHAARRRRPHVPPVPARRASAGVGHGRPWRLLRAGSQPRTRRHDPRDHRGAGVRRPRHRRPARRPGRDCDVRLGLGWARPHRRRLPGQGGHARECRTCSTRSSSPPRSGPRSSPA